MIEIDNTRRLLVAAGTGFALAGANFSAVLAEEKHAAEKEVTAVEDLMREHGVIRRAILVYRDIATKLRTKPASVDLKLLGRTADLFRSFGENYHEKELEETHIFPIVRKAGGQASAYVDTLISQHQRSHELTDYVLAAVAKGGVSATEAESLARVLDSVELMYEHHSAREDTVVFPAWKEALSPRQLDEMGETFEEIEHRKFGKDGFEDAVAQISAIEQALGVADLERFTAPPPAKL